MSISTIIIGVVIFVVLGIFLKYKTGKKKLPSDRSNAEKLANTLHTKFDKFMKDLNNGIRTPEFIQEEMLMTLEEEFGISLSDEGVIILINLPVA